MRLFEKWQRVVVLLLSSMLVATTLAYNENYTMNINLTDGNVVQFDLTSQDPSVYCNNGQMTIYYYNQESEQYLNLSFERDLVKDLTFHTTSLEPVPANNIIMYAPNNTPVLIDDIDRVTFESDTESADATEENPDILKMYMNDGTIHSQLCGKYVASIWLFKYTPYDNTYKSTTNHKNDYTVEWNVNGVGVKDSCYSVGIYWEKALSNFKNVRSGICFGTSPNLTIEQSDFVRYLENSSDFFTLNPHYVFVGSKLSLPMYLEGCDYCFDNYSTYKVVQVREENWLNIPLEYGKTYYYRTFIQGEMLQHGDMKAETFYDVEKSFRVPKVMEDAGYIGFPIPTEKACQAFGAHFPDFVTAPSKEQILELWYEWQQTNEAQQINLSSYCTPVEFDNGNGYDLHRIPDEFYKWLTHREIVIDVYDGIAELSKKTTEGDSIVTIKPVVIRNVDPSWNIPNNRYVRFDQQTTTMNHYVKYRSNKVIPGVHYKLQVKFAPETTYESKLPFKVDIDVFPIFGNEGISLVKKFDVSGTETTSFEIDNIDVNKMGFDLIIRTNVSPSEVRNHNYTRVMRIADIRLVPMIKDTVATPTFTWEGDKLAISTTTVGADIYYSTKEYDITPSGNGTLSSPYNVAGVLQYISTLETDNPSPDSLYIKGVISSIRGVYPKYGNADFYITDNGNENGSSLFAFRVRGLGNQLITSTDAVKVSDEVIIRGKVTNYKGNTPETVGYSAYIYAFTTPEPNTLYQGPISIEKNVIVRAKAKKEGMDDSEMAMLTIREDPYAVLSDDNTVLTFYYDNMEKVRGGMSVDPFNGYPTWYTYRNHISTIVFDTSFANCTTLTSTANWFYDCSNLKSIKGIENLNTAKVTDMRYMFYNCSSLTKLNLSTFNTINVKDMNGMFTNCISLIDLELNSFNTSNVTDMKEMFSGCWGLETLDISNFNTSNVTNMNGMFAGCYSLKTIDLSNFNTSNVTNMQKMFFLCQELRSIYVGSEWSIMSVEQGDEMFYSCDSLVGGHGTTYDADHTDYTYAHIDGGPSNPGYFTDSRIELSDWQILKQVYNELNGDKWAHHWHFSDEPTSVKDYPGVRMEKCRVVEIDLSNNNIEGSFPCRLLTLPYLKKLNISGNSFYGDIGTTISLFVQQNPSLSDKIQELNISNNKFTGNIGLFASYFTQLETLDASNNCLEDVHPIIPSTVTTLDISKQTISRVVPLHLANLSMDSIIKKVPSILLYDHANQTFTPNINLLCTTHDDSWSMTMAYQDGAFSIPFVSEQNTYYGESSDTLNVTVINSDGSREGSTFRISLSFDEGDGNFDGQVNVLDLQTTLNYMFEEYTNKPYNFTASNLWKDEVINVQDAVCLVNMLLDTDVSSARRIYTTRRNAKPSSESPAAINIENGFLKIISSVPVSAFDITISTDQKAEILSTLNDMGFTCTSRQNGNIVHLIGYSVSGAEIPKGETTLCKLNSGVITHVMLADKKACEIHASKNSTATGLQSSKQNSSSPEVYRIPLGIKRAIIIDKTGRKTLIQNNNPQNN